MKVLPFFSSEEKGKMEPGLLQLLPDFAFGFDSAFQKVLYANPACESFLGLPASQVMGTRLTEWVTSDTLVPFLTAVKTGGNLRCRLEFRRPDGRTIWGEFVGVSQAKGGEVWGICREVTDQVRLETELQDLLSVREQLLVVVSHDLRSAFSGILSVSEILSRDETLATNPETAEYLDILQSSAHQTQLLMENLLHWAQAQRRGRMLKPQWMNAAALADQLMEQFSPVARMKRVQLNAAYPQDIPLSADEDLLNVILRNLLNNAVKFTRTGGRITLAVSLIQENGREVCEFAVEDNGVGMAPDVLEGLRRGQELSTKGTCKEKGHGVGLRICRDFLAAHGSRLHITSTLGVGSRFSFRLPIAPIPSP